MKTIKFIVPAIFILFLMSCKPIVTKLSADYVGSWEGDGSSYSFITIDSDGNGAYEGFSGIASVSFTGKTRLRGDKFKIGLKKFKFNYGPTYDITTGYWTMKLDDIIYYRY